MKRRVVKISRKASGKYFVELDSTEFLLLAFVAVSLVTFFAWKTNLLPKFITGSL